ncbi:dna repair and recombination protein pif1 [Moniliophthora roreri MCA 2997]|uniref:ATP-dependent DNA helicase PIF1 n=1 Tax=Moniliophthora roreri (strain MCA 2997) TaxID=1381753 RepID=V2XWW7_MONRO|nr:dna repair and recombination protein pif1 [Moniliophthora roreri MCA 2997]
MAKVKFYAVRRGREGPKCKANTSRFQSAEYKSFHSKAEAQIWIAEAAGLILNASPTLNASNLSIHDSDSEIEFLEGPAVKHQRTTPQRTLQTFDEDDEDIEFISHKPAPAQVANSPIVPATACPSEPAALSPSHVANSSTVSEPIVLSPEQKRVLDLVKRGRSVFYTGSAGTGKSVLLREIIGWLKNEKKKVAITASTGIAAINIGGTTLHSWAGIGIGNDTAKKTAIKFFTNAGRFRDVLNRWHTVEVLIIDEVSMLDGRLFDLLEELARTIREKKDLPFGGMQLVLSGDFCQLPPVPDRDKSGAQAQSRFAFEADSWNSCIGPPIVLQKVFRQKEQRFVDMLNAMRFGNLDSSIVSSFRALSRKIEYTDGIEPTELFPTRNEVDRANTARLNQIKETPIVYKAYDMPGKDSNDVNISYAQAMRLLDHRTTVPQMLQLKVGAQVMLVKNIHHEGLVNGSIGQINRFCTVSDALRDHVSVTRVKTGQDQSLEKDPDVQKNLSEKRVWPVVCFPSGKQILCIPLEFEVVNASGGMEARRDQVPLILAWALSIHKSQGQTLERVKVDLRNIFEKGQAYVALSRATTMEHLQVLNFDPSKVTAHPRVLAWYQRHGGSQVANVSDEEDYDKYFDDIPMDFDEMDSEMAMEAFYS